MINRIGGNGRGPAQQIITIKTFDRRFETNGCEGWRKGTTTAGDVRVTGWL